MASATLSHAQNPPMELSAVENNALRLSIVAQRLKLLFSSGSRSSDDLLKPCISLARSIDYALSKNDVPQIAFHLPSLVKQVYQHKNEASLQSAITLLMMAVKNACRSRWFCSGDSDDLLKMANELVGSFCAGNGTTNEMSNALNTISKVIPRFYPQLKLGHLLVSFEAKPGYAVLMSDFHIEKFTACEETIRLFIAETDDLETSSCLISPSEVSFLVNGKGVAGRTNVFQDKGPQLPTDVTKLLKYGTNIIQAVGHFRGNYIIAVTFMSKVTDFRGSNLKDYVQSAITALAPEDPEVIEESTRISLNCPISLSRIGTPVKGYLCKHFQCFDYDNFLEMNSRKPLWRCPFCNQPTSFIDLRIDQNMVKILRDVTIDATNVVIYADGSWEVVFDRGRSTVHLPNGTLANQQDQAIGGESNSILDTLQNAVDLTMDEDARSNSKTYEIEDRKPLKDFQAFPVPESFPEQALSHHANVRARGGVVSLLSGDICPQTLSSSASLGSSVLSTALDAYTVGTLESLVPTSVLNPVIRDTISPPGQGVTASLLVNQQASTFQNTELAGQLSDDLQIQMPRPINSVINRETERQPIPRQVSRVPIANHSLPARNEVCSSYQLTRHDLPNSSFNIHRNSPSLSYQTNPPTAAIRDGLRIQTLPANAEASTSSEWAHQYLMNSGLNTTRGSSIISHQTVSTVTAIPHGDVDMQLVASGLDIYSPVQQLHSMIQNQDQGFQSSAFQQVAELPTSIQVRTVFPAGLRTTGAYKAPRQPLSDHQFHPNQLVNSVKGQQTLSQCTSTAHSSYHPSQNVVDIPPVNLVNYYNRVLATQRAAAKMVRLPSVHPYASTSGSSLLTMADSSQLTGVQQLQNTVGGPVAVSDRNWHPTGRMRGSLSGNEYSEALNHYLVHPSQSVTATPLAPSVVAPQQLLVSNSNSNFVHGSLVQQANWMHNGSGN